MCPLSTVKSSKKRKQPFVALSRANKVYFIPTYASREKGKDNGSLVKAVKNSIFITKNLDSTLEREINNFDALCFMGAGDIDDIGRNFIKNYD